MFGDLMNNMEERQKAMKSKLAQILVDAEAGNGAIKITANANGEIINISINKEALDWDDHEQLEDLLVVAINKVLEKAADKEASETENLINDMLPPGLDNFKDLFG